MKRTNGFDLYLNPDIARIRAEIYDQLEAHKFFSSESKELQSFNLTVPYEGNPWENPGAPKSYDFVVVVCQHPNKGFGLLRARQGIRVSGKRFVPEKCMATLLFSQREALTTGRQGPGVNCTLYKNALDTLLVMLKEKRIKPIPSPKI